MLIFQAGMAESADALASGASGGNLVEVQVFLTAPLGRYDGGGPSSYINKAGNTTYFSLGDDWNTIQDTYNLSDTDLFDLFNKPALDDAVSAGKTIRFSHDPTDINFKGKSLWNEWEYLKNKYGYKKLFSEGDFWYGIR